MRIERLTLHGFKSFGDRTTVEFSPGVTAVVGPNGSGKSNILDALRWATGGGRASEFRAGEKTELIFHGAAGKKRVGRAEVEVELVAEGRRIKVRRSLDRDGQTKLRLNGRNARFLDLEEELAGSGLGKGSLAVIGQGEVSGVLMADPERLLSYVAEAAGVARLSGRRETTEDRLDQARGHLDRLEERLEADAARLEVLSRDAADAARFDELTARVLRLRLTVADARVRTLRAEEADLQAEVVAREEAVAEGREESARLQAGMVALREADAAAEAAHREATAAHARAAAEVRVAQHALEVATSRAAETASRRDRLEAELAALGEETEPVAPDVDPEASEAAVREAEAALTAARERLARANEEAEAARLERERVETAAARAERDAAEASARLEALTLQHDEVVARLASAPAEAAEEDEGTGPVEDEREAAGRVEEAERALAEVRTRLEAAQAKHADEAAEARALARAAERGRAALEARRGYAEGPRHALTSGVPGVIGSVADLITVPSELQEAVGLALGRRAEYVVVEDSDTAQAVLAHVRRAGGWVTLLPLDLVRAQTPRLDASVAGARGVLGLASELVRCDARFRTVVDQLLGGTALMETTEQATALARRASRRPRLVTLDGGIVEPGGAVSGGRRRGASPVLGAAAELEEAERGRDEAEAREARAAEAVRAQQEAYRQASAHLASAREAHGAAREAASRWRERRAADERVRSELEARRTRLESALADLPDAPERVAEETLAEVRGRDERARAALERARAEEAPAAERAARAARAAALADERRRGHLAAVARWREDQERARALEREVAELEVAARAAWAAAEEADRRVASARAALPDDLEEVGRTREEAREALRRAEAELHEAGRRQAERGEALERARVGLARRETALETAEAERAAFPEGLEPLETSERAARSELREAEADLERLGAVNHRAARELEELGGEHEERRREASEARTAVEELSRTLTRLDQETTERLNRAIAGLRESFHRHIDELFGPEGEGEIETDYEDERPVGLRIRLRPPGKNTQSLGLLSVGERTMGALAFLFALMGEERGQAGLPVAVLDEVDAPLDEANIRRYRSFLERLAAGGTQFVLITHQKATFEVADVLWGVTTERGVSRVFSIRKEEVPGGDGRGAAAPVGAAGA